MNTMMKKRTSMEIDEETRESLLRYFDNDDELGIFLDEMTSLSADGDKRKALEDYLAGKVPPEIAGFNPEKFIRETAEKISGKRNPTTKTTNLHLISIIKTHP